ncbi:rhamnogalacturonan lyase [Flectobacillus roseus]|uniref:Rhamnogalacturonan lyase n=1 Tax=Flectobacillus roseus TaxID=502259 RepID=A0ABT6Y7K9_9BACT|nr:rhamnogalacturonan lyase [Flectobacillus roseus]MDI9859564.1 rhamnogalacturonan lyase [Flectobacillus roseus]
MKKIVSKVLPFALGLLLSSGVMAQYQLENLDRGLVAVRTNPKSVFLSWRILGTDAKNVAFNIYRGKTKLNTSPITTVSNWVDSTGIESSEYSLCAVINGKEQKSIYTQVLSQNFIEIPLKMPEGGTTPDGKPYTYSASDCSVGDLDGDGQYEIVLKWDPTNSKDNSQKGYTGNVYLDAYRMDGKQLWRIDLGKNIRAGAHYTQFMVFDFDGDGKAEIACKTADGTTDASGKIIGDAKADYRNEAGYVLDGPEFLTVFEGISGKILDSVPFTPERGEVGAWGDKYGNRVDRFISAVAYLDGKHPSLITGRGYYTRLVRTAWDFEKGKIKMRWNFDSNDAGNEAHRSMGNHQMSIADLDGDGKQEVISGSSVIASNGKSFYANGLGHGDALHVSDMDPTIKGLELWQCHEEPAKYGEYGMEFRGALSGKPLWGVSGEGKDIGRCMAADIDPTHYGYEVWGSVGGLYDCKGNQISANRPRSMNFAVWWDGDLTRELLDGNHVDKWDYQNGQLVRLFTAEGCSSNNGTKATPAVSADLFGDWREEVVLKKSDSSALRIFTTTIPTTYKMPTLMHDAQYRVAIAWQNSGYNQPPHPSFYLGEIAPK